MMQPSEVNHNYNGIQKIYKFSNGYGASVIKHDFSHGHSDGLWELAVIMKTDEHFTEWTIDYDHPESHGDVRGWLTDRMVEDILINIKGDSECLI